jgi:iron complex outermembrane recepter protein
MFEVCQTKNKVRTACCALACLISCAICTFANPQVNLSAGLKTLTLEELMGIEVTSVSKTEETLGGAAAAVTVVTNQDIRRSGATSLPDALRLVPGLHVARQTSNLWAVTSRGFSGTNSEKLLVLSDTRSIYTPLFSGVFWDAQDFMLQDIDRIEVIRGPGAALWGSNAVNGVINITTKSARDTQGTYVEAAGGTEENAFAGARYGGKTSNGIYYRVFGKYFDRDSSFHSKTVTSDDSRLGHLGFRADWDKTQKDVITLQGDVYRGNIGRLTPSATIGARPMPTGNLEIGVSGGNVLGRWRHTTNENSDLQFRVYYDRTHRNDPNFVDDLDTVDLDFQHRSMLPLRQEVIWGLNYRFTNNLNESKILFAVDPPRSHDSLVSGFVQNQITLRDSLRVTLGTKLEHNDFSGYEVQPGARAAWDFASGQTVWAAVSRAVRVPTRFERDINIDATNPAASSVFRLLGNKDFDSEKLTAYEVGYRAQVLENLVFDVAAFYNRYRGLASLELGTAFIEPVTAKTITPIINQNLTNGATQGIETLVTFSPRDSWRLSASHSYINLDLNAKGQDRNRGGFFERATPRHQFGVRSFLDLPKNLQLDAQFRHLTAIRSLPALATDPGIPRYSELDARVAWHGWRQAEISLVGQNLLHDHHVEFGTPIQRGEIQRSIYAKIAWGF